MQKEWKQLERDWASAHPEFIAALNPPASAFEIADLERGLGASLPTDYRECLHVHNGQKPNASWVFFDTEFLSTKRILQEWTVWRELWKSGEFAGLSAKPDAGIKNEWWSPRWIPITYNGSGDHICLDLDPEKGGTYGQVIAFWHDDSARTLEAVSFGEWFRKMKG